jgi:hypothetical protein
VGRHNRRREDSGPLDLDRARFGVPSMQSGPDGEWSVRPISADYATKTYRCPGCDQEIAPGIAHVVAWPADHRGDLTDRRHWHTGCWHARTRRRPTR